jgi:hypothetical protein
MLSRVPICRSPAATLKPSAPFAEDGCKASTDRTPATQQ